MKLFCDSKNYKIYNGSMLDMLEVIEENSIDSIVCDPPYELGFMGRSWDKSGITFQKETWGKCLKVLKPGGYLLAFGGSRTFHRIAVAIEEAGFEIRDTIMWIYGSGFPKSLNVAKAISAYEKTGGSSPRNLRKDRLGDDYEPTGQKDYRKGRAFSSEIKDDNKKTELTDNAKKYEGWGTCLKPAYEPIIVARKPFKSSVAENIMKYGVGGINIDECRVDYNGEIPNVGGRANHTRGDGYGFKALGKECKPNTKGRFPANVIHDGSEEVISGFPSSDRPNGSISKQYKMNNLVYGKYGNCNEFDSYGDVGSASRYFYCAKASKKDRDEGLGIETEEYVLKENINEDIKNNIKRLLNL